MAYRVFQSYNISLPNRVTWVDFIELDVFDFYVILVMDLLHAYFSSIYCQTRVVKFKFPNEHVLE